MSTIRQMQKRDLHTVSMTLVKAFSQGRVDDGYSNTHVPMCRQEFMEMYFYECNGGAFIAEESGKLEAISFCHVWGKTGWIGPLAVVPDKHLRGVGKQIILHSIAYLKEKDCTTIGLETNPRSNRNLGFYGKSGFFPSALSIDLILPSTNNQRVSPNLPHQTVYYSKLSKENKTKFLGYVKSLIEMTGMAVDYTPLIQSVNHAQFGESLLFMRNNAPVGYTTIQTEPTASEESNKIVRTVAFVSHPKTPDDYFRYFMQNLQLFAQKKSMDQILVRVPVRAPRVLKLLLNLGYRVIHSDERMTLEGYPEQVHPDVIQFSRWV